jgi:hypothetical protein
MPGSGPQPTALAGAVSIAARCLALGLLLVVAACAAPRQQELSDDEILAIFERVAFRLDEQFVENAERNKTGYRLSKWREPVRYVTLGRSAPRYQAHVAKLARELSAVTGHPVLPAGTATANALVVFVEGGFEDAPVSQRKLFQMFFDNELEMRTFFERLSREALCFGAFTYGHGGQNEISAAVVLIPDNLAPREIPICIVQEIAQTMGVPNDDNTVRPSVFNDPGGATTLAEIDRIMLRLLYDERLEPGMAWEEAEPIARQILMDLRRKKATS